MQIPDGEHEYLVQTKISEEAGINDARIIVEWSEPLVMAPPPVGGVLVVQTDPSTQSERAASGPVLPLPASVALGLLVIGAGGIYVVKMRH